MTDTEEPEMTEVDETTADEDEDELDRGSQENAKAPPRRLDPDPEDDRVRDEAELSHDDDRIEKCFDREFEHPKLNGSLSRFIEKGYAKLGRSLNQDLMAEGLTMIAKTITGLHHAFVKLDLIGKAITEISLIKNFTHLRYVLLAGNHLLDIKPLNSLPFLMALDLSDNYLTSVASLMPRPYLRNLNLSKNLLKDLQGAVEHPYLQRLYLSYNKLPFFALDSPKYLRELEVLELRRNRLRNFGDDTLKLPALKYLFLAQNSIDRLGTFAQIGKLEFLDVRRNKILSLGSSLWPKLQCLNASWNFLSDPSQIEKLATNAPELRTLLLKNNAINGDEQTELKAIVLFKKLSRFNNTPITKEIRQDAQEEYEEIQAEIGDGNEQPAKVEQA